MTAKERPYADFVKMILSDGRAIISQEPASGRHPNHMISEPVLFKNAVRLLVDDDADGATLYACTYPTNSGRPCGKTWDEIGSVASHQSTHKRVTTGTYYDRRTLQAVTDAVAEARDTGVRGFMEMAAKMLNDSGIRTQRNGDWTSAAVSSTWNAHCRGIRPRRRTKRVTITPTPVIIAAAIEQPESQSELDITAAVTEMTRSSAPMQTFIDALGRLDVCIRNVKKALNDLGPTFDAMTQLDEETIAKAKKWDALKESLS